MGENDKPFACTSEGCQMTFTNEDHLTVHRKKHDMVLNLGLNCKNSVAADQTPTPTRFIRNCEEVGLFQDLQNVNPFEETFKKAIEYSKTGIIHIPDSPNDDSLHTPQILHHTPENLSKHSYTPDKHFDDTSTIDGILRIDSRDSSSKDDCSSPVDNCIGIKESSFSYTTELSTSNERDYELSSSTSNDTTVEELSIVKKNLNSYLLKSNVSRYQTKSNVKEKIKEVLHNKRKSEVKPLDLKMKDSDNTKKPRQRINLKSKLKSVEAEVIKIEDHGNVDLYDKNLNEVEKRRAMNRMAQMRSRKRKKMWLDQMEKEIEKLKTDNKLIVMENQKLKEENIALKLMLLKHNNCSLSTNSNVQNGKIAVKASSEAKSDSLQQSSPLLYNTYAVDFSQVSTIQTSPIVKTNVLQFVQRPLPKLLPKRETKTNKTFKKSAS
ncbi:hypothetical protein AMK59_4154 [Oryctes borbonicus]|uniref:BZIP domain-containing protein n=1 Tax=Oryctes borbonicus TaxID=1629725 RepID=A0A0T6B7C1_9SCAR|nr:hypothetical protein AMK59_4154 [Oryctes borbonicus]